MAKRKLELDDLQEITDPVPAASLHGVIQSLSPLKKGKQCDYYEGRFKLNDNSTQRFVGFKKSQQVKLKQLMDDMKPVHLDDCEIKKVRRGNTMEILVKSTTNIVQSPKKFNPHFLDSVDQVTPLNLLQSKEVYERINVKVKIIKVNEPTTIPAGRNAGKEVQEVIIADATASAKCTLWETSINTLHVNKSYHLQQFYVQEFGSKKYLSMQKEGSEMISIDDIADVDVVDEEDDEQTLTNVSVVGIQKLDTYRSCLRCKARIEPTDSTTGRCSKPDCLMLQRYDICKQQLSANLLFQCNSDLISLYTNGVTLLQMTKLTKISEITEEVLLQLPQFSLIKHKYNTVTSFYF